MRSEFQWHQRYTQPKKPYLNQSVGFRIGYVNFLTYHIRFCYIVWFFLGMRPIYNRFLSHQLLVHNFWRNPSSFCNQSCKQQNLLILNCRISYSFVNQSHYRAQFIYSTKLTSTIYSNGTQRVIQDSVPSSHFWRPPLSPTYHKCQHHLGPGYGAAAKD